MRLVTFSIDQIRAMPRPPEYLDELRAVAVSTTSTSMTFDADSNGWRQLKAKYAAPVKAAAPAHRGCGCGRARK